MSIVLSEDKTQSTGIKMLLVAVLCLGLNWPGMKVGLEIVGPIWMVCLRFLLSLPVIALFVLITKKSPTPIESSRSRCGANGRFLPIYLVYGADHRFFAVYPSRDSQHSYLYNTALDVAD